MKQLLSFEGEAMMVETTNKITLIWHELPGFIRFHLNVGTESEEEKQLREQRHFSSYDYGADRPKQDEWMGKYVAKGKRIEIIDPRANGSDLEEWLLFVYYPELKKWGSACDGCEPTEESFSECLACC
jgi:hypothetical protein